MKIFNQSVFETWPIEDKSCQSVITSPPYWSLRKYSIPDIIIGGDKDCVHEWGETTTCRYGNNSMVGRTPGSKDGTFCVPKFKDSGMKQGIYPVGNYCNTCGAWQGQYGLEPTFKLYLEHTMLWIKEAMRVLRDDGCLFINIADSYASSGGASRHKDPKYPNGRSGEFDEPSSFPQGNVQPKSKCLIPERLAIMCVDELNLILRNHIVWEKPNGMPESVTDRFSKKWESVFMFTKKPDYYFDLDGVREVKTTKENRPDGVVRNRIYNYQGKYAEKLNKCFTQEGICKSCGTPINKHFQGDKNVGDDKQGMKSFIEFEGKLLKCCNENGKNPGDVWNIPTSPSSEKHFAMWPEKLVERMILCSTKKGDIVLDPFCGSCTTGRVAVKHQRKFIGIDLGYEEMQERRGKNIQVNLI